MALRTDREKCAHLLRRFGLGASEAELDFYLKDGLKGAIDQLLAYEEIEEAFDLDIEELVNDNGNLNLPSVMSWWGFRIVTTRRPLQEKMTLFWHDHFATSASKVTQAPLMHQQNVVLRQHATGKFEKLLLAASQDPAMLFWLDNQFNVRGKPNENFAREVMELFTLGIGHYTEQDVQEAARAFTGWTIGRAQRGDAPGTPRASFVFRPILHDTGPKQFLGNTGRFSGEDVVSLLCSNPQTSLYLTTKIWEWFAYLSPEPSLIERLAKKFSDSGLDIQVLLRAVMESSEFYSDKAERRVYKNPVDFTAATMRQLGVGETLANAMKNTDAERRRTRLVPIVAMTQSCNGMGMRLLYPPDVAGWDGGSAWISSGTMVERIKWADTLFGQAGNATSGRRPQVQYQSVGLYQKDPSAQGVVDTLLSIYDAPMSEAKKADLLSAAQKASGGRVTPATANATSAAVSRLIFGSPEFQFA